MDIEIVVNKEINDYKESIFFGLSLRQFICSIAAVAAAVILYLLLIGKLGRQITSWLCIIGAAPLAVAGFFKYNGLTLERFIWAVVKTNWLLAGRRLYRAENYSYRFMQNVYAELEQKIKPQPFLCRQLNKGKRLITFWIIPPKRKGIFPNKPKSTIGMKDVLDVQRKRHG